MSAVGSFSVVQSAFAQSGQRSDVPQNEVALVNLSQPCYPPLARQARIQGDVEVTFGVRRAGNIESAAIASGHPMFGDLGVHGQPPRWLLPWIRRRARRRAYWPGVGRLVWDRRERSARREHGSWKWLRAPRGGIAVRD